MVFKDAARSLHTLKIVAAHTYQIPECLYALIGCIFVRSSDVWFIGWQRENGEFGKLSVFHLTDDEQVKHRTLRLKEVKTILC